MCGDDGEAVAAAVAIVRFEADCAEERVTSATNCKGSCSAGDRWRRRALSVAIKPEDDNKSRWLSDEGKTNVKRFNWNGMAQRETGRAAGFYSCWARREGDGRLTGTLAADRRWSR